MKCESIQNTLGVTYNDPRDPSVNRAGHVRNLNGEDTTIYKTDISWYL